MISGRRDFDEDVVAVGAEDTIYSYEVNENKSRTDDSLYLGFSESFRRPVLIRS